MGHDCRLRGVIVVLWRAGLRIHEALALNQPALDHRRGAVLVRRGKGGRRHGGRHGRMGLRRRFAPHQLRHAHAVESLTRACRSSSSSDSSVTATSGSPRSTCRASTTRRSSRPSTPAARPIVPVSATRRVGRSAARRAEGAARRTDFTRQHESDSSRPPVALALAVGDTAVQPVIQAIGCSISLSLRRRAWARARPMVETAATRASLVLSAPSRLAMTCRGRTMRPIAPDIANDQLDSAAEELLELAAAAALTFDRGRQLGPISAATETPKLPLPFAHSSSEGHCGPTDRNSTTRWRRPSPADRRAICSGRRRDWLALVRDPSEIPTRRPGRPMRCR
jgi:hypothetical protein